MLEEPQGGGPKARGDSPLGARAREHAPDVVALVLLVLLLSGWLNVRYPAPDQEGSFLPATEVVMVFGLIALARYNGVRLRGWAFALLALVGVVVRLFLVADNVSHQYLFRDFRVPLDFYLLPEFVRLLHDTTSKGTLAGYAALLFAALAASFVLLWWSFAQVYRRAGRPTFQRAVAGLVVLTVAAVAARELGGPLLYNGSASRRVVREVRRLRRLPQERQAFVQSVAAVRQRLGEGRRLDKLEGNNVLFMFVESYGRTSLVHPKHREVLLPRYREMEKTLEAEGFHVASNYVTSPTYGGFSWFAHATLDTGVKVTNHLHSRLLDEQSPVTLADQFRGAGYEPILVAPGTSRAWPGMDDYYGFRKHYYAWEFEYEGPRYAWGTMADQYVLYYIHQREIERRQKPLFLQYALVSSHAPFSDVPRYVENWSRLGHGAGLRRAGRDQFDTKWDDPKQLAEGYAAAISYDLRVIENYLTKFIKDDSLVIFMGDHQPHTGVTGRGAEHKTWSVPSHVASRNPAFIAPFLKRGYTRGMVPEQPLPHVGMERFMEELLSDFSTEPLAVNPGIWSPDQERPQEGEGETR
jgi:hypothetical protein